MANWLIDYIEMTEYIPNELREQLTSIRELDLKVHNAMDELERDIKQFFSKINSLSPQERQSQYDAFLKKCDVATQAAGDKVRVADRLHVLVEKSMRLLDQGLEKLKEDLLEGDKAYIVEDLERRSQELDEQLRLEQEQIKHRHESHLNDPHQSHRSKATTHSKGHRSNSINSNLSSTINSNHHHHHHNHHHHHHSNHHRYSNHLNSHNHNHNSSSSSTGNHHHNHFHHIQHHSTIHGRHRHNSTGTGTTSQQLNNATGVGRQRKRDKKRLSNSMTIFNRNSRTDDDSTNQTYLSSPSTPDHLAGLRNSSSSSFNDTTGCGGSINGNNGLSTLKGMIANSNNVNGVAARLDPLAKASQPILTAIDAAHAVSPNATNSDKLVLFSSNGDTHTKNPYANNALAMEDQKSVPSQNNQQQQLGVATTVDVSFQKSDNNKQPINNGTGNASRPHTSSQLSNHLLSPIGCNSSSSVSSKPNQLNGAIAKELHQSSYDQPTRHNSYNHNSNCNQFVNNATNTNAPTTGQNHNRPGNSGVFSSLPTLSARQDPIMLAASQAINATQSMAPGRRTSSLKASYAAVNSGRLQTTSTPAPTSTITNTTLATTITGGSEYLFEQGSSMNTNETYCKCRGGIQDPNMIACDNRDCKIEWFHWQCVGITTPPEGEWYCDDCRHSLGRHSKTNFSGNKQSRASGLASSAT